MSLGTGEQSAGRPAEAPAGTKIPTNSLCGENVGRYFGRRFPAGDDWWEGKRLTGRAGSFAVGDADAAGDIRAYVGIYYCVFDGDGPSSF